MMTMVARSVATGPIADVAQTCCWLDPVANDPTETSAIEDCLPRKMSYGAFGTAEAARIDVPVLSMVGSESDAAFFEMEELLTGVAPTAGNGARARP
jgi:hypothetical protein